MFDFNLLKGEKINFINDDTILKFKSNEDMVSIIITNQRFIILKFPDDVEAFRFGRVINYPNPRKKEVIFETKIENILSIEEFNHFDKITLKDTNYFFIRSDEVRDYLKKIYK